MPIVWWLNQFRCFVDRGTTKILCATNLILFGWYRFAYQDASDSQDSWAPESHLRKRTHAGMLNRAFVNPFSGPAHASSSRYGASSGVAQRDAAAGVLQVCAPLSRNSFL